MTEINEEQTELHIHVRSVYADHISTMPISVVIMRVNLQTLNEKLDRKYVHVVDCTRIPSINGNENSRKLVQFYLIKQNEDSVIRTEFFWRSVIM